MKHEGSHNLSKTSNQTTMSDEEVPPKAKNSYPETAAALITPPKEPNEQPLTPTDPVQTPNASSGNSLKPFYLRNDEELFTPAEYGNDFEPLPFISGGSFSPNSSLGTNNALNNHLWQLVYSPLQTPGPCDQGSPLPPLLQTLPGGIMQQAEMQKDQSPIEFNEATIPKNDAPKDDGKPPHFQDKGKVNGDEREPPPYPQHHWQTYHPPPYYWYHHHYGYPHQYLPGPQDDQRRLSLSQPNLFPKKAQSGNYPHVFRPPAPYGHFSKPLLIGSHPQPAAQQEFITKVTNDDVICGRGGAINNLPGNKRFRQFIQDFKHRYLNETKQRKPLVAMLVLEAVKPGRFLVKVNQPNNSPPSYVECPVERAREKASQALREAAAKLRKQELGTEDGAGKKRAKGELGGAKDEIVKGGLVVKKILLPNEKECGESYCDDPEFSSDFEPPQKKIKQEAV